MTSIWSVWLKWSSVIRILFSLVAQLRLTLCVKDCSCCCSCRSLDGLILIGQISVCRKMITGCLFVQVLKYNNSCLCKRNKNIGKGDNLISVCCCCCKFNSLSISLTFTILIRLSGCGIDQRSGKVICFTGIKVSVSSLIVDIYSFLISKGMSSVISVSSGCLYINFFSLNGLAFISQVCVCRNECII